MTCPCGYGCPDGDGCLNRDTFDDEPKEQRWCECDIGMPTQEEQDNGVCDACGGVL